MTNISAAFDEENLETVVHDPEGKIVALCQAFKAGDKTALTKWFAEADEDDYQTHRKAVRDVLGWQQAAVDNKRKKLYVRTEPNDENSSLEWDSPEPWNEPVNGAELLDSIFDFIQTHIILKKEFNATVAVWIVMTWLHESLEVAPFLNITSATKECGKSTLLDVVEELVKNPLPSAGPMSVAVLVRVIEKYKKTLLLDEFDKCLKNNPDLLAVINGSHKKSRAFAYRCGNSEANHDVSPYKTWAPKAITGIGSIPDTVLSRCIKIKMERHITKGTRIILFRLRDKQKLLEIKQKIVRWISDNKNELLVQLDKVVYPENINDRSADNWECLFAIANVAGGCWPEKIFSACSKANQEKDELGLLELLVADIYKIHEKEKAKCAQQGSPAPKHISTENLIEKLINIDDSPWAELSRGKPISKVKLARLLKPFDISPGTIRTSAGTPKGYKWSAFTKTWKQYQNATTPQPAENSAELDFSKRHKKENVAAPNSPKPSSSNVCGVVTDEIPQNSGEREEYEGLI